MRKKPPTHVTSAVREEMNGMRGWKRLELEDNHHPAHIQCVSQSGGGGMIKIEFIEQILKNSLGPGDRFVVTKEL